MKQIPQAAYQLGIAMARALLKAREDDTVTLRLPNGVDELVVISCIPHHQPG